MLVALRLKTPLLLYFDCEKVTRIIHLAPIIVLDWICARPFRLDSSRDPNIEIFLEEYAIT